MYAPFLLVVRSTFLFVCSNAWNAQQPPEVVKILYDNKVKLVKYLEGLHKERENSDEQYRDEKQLVISTLEGLEL